MKSAFYDTLRDGTPIFFRLVRPEDRDKLAEGFSKLSPRSKKFRFAYPLCRLRQDQLEYLTDIDNVNHLAFGVLDVSRSDKPGIGIARYVRSEENPQKAEIAVTVIDEYQNRGLGTKLMYALGEAAAEFGIIDFFGYVLFENRAMLRLLTHFDASFVRESAVLLRAEFPVISCNPSCSVASLGAGHFDRSCVFVQ